MDTVELRKSMKNLNKSIYTYKKKVGELEKKVTEKNDYSQKDLDTWINDKIKLLELEEQATGLMEIYKTMKEMDEK